MMLCCMKALQFPSWSSSPITSPSSVVTGPHLSLMFYGFLNTLATFHTSSAFSTKSFQCSCLASFIFLLSSLLASLSFLTFFLRGFHSHFHHLFDIDHTLTTLVHCLSSRCVRALAASPVYSYWCSYRPSPASLYSFSLSMYSPTFHPYVIQSSVSISSCRTLFLVPLKQLKSPMIVSISLIIPCSVALTLCWSQCGGR